MAHFSTWEDDSSAPEQQDNTIFDASQYDFFGKNIMEHDLGELDHNMDFPPTWGLEDQSLLSSEVGKGKNVGNVSSVDDLANTYAKPGVYYYRRLSGFIRSFNNERGYGFIKPYHGGNDIFVHHSSVKSDGCIQMWAGMHVEYETVGHESKAQAINVTGPGGILLKGRKRISHGEGSSRSSRNSANYLNIGPCFNCGQLGHLAKNCYPTHECVPSVPGSKHWKPIQRE